MSMQPAITTSCTDAVQLQRRRLRQPAQESLSVAAAPPAPTPLRSMCMASVGIRRCMAALPALVTLLCSSGEPLPHVWFVVPLPCLWAGTCGPAEEAVVSPFPK